MVDVERQIQITLKNFVTDELGIRTVVYPYDFTPHPDYTETPFIVIKTALANMQGYVGDNFLLQTLDRYYIELTPISYNQHETRKHRNALLRCLRRWGPLLDLLMNGQLRTVPQVSGPVPATARNIDSPLWAYPLRLLFTVTTYPGGEVMSWLERYFVKGKKIQKQNDVFTIPERIILSSLEVFANGLLIDPDRIDITATEPTVQFRLDDKTIEEVVVNYIRS